VPRPVDAAQRGALFLEQQELAAAAEIADFVDRRAVAALEEPLDRERGVDQPGELRRVGGGSGADGAASPGLRGLEGLEVTCVMVYSRVV
jgi:hypothetical protein